MKINSFNGKDVSTRTISAMLLLLYSCTSLLSHFPAFHNHGPTVINTCCQKNESCCTDSRGVVHTHTAAVLTSGCGVRQIGGPCMACMWQALAKRQADLCNPMPIITPILLRKFKIPKESSFSQTSLRKKQPRAPPA